MATKFEIIENSQYENISWYFNIKSDVINPLELEKELIDIKTYLENKYVDKKYTEKITFLEYIKRKVGLI